MFKKILFAAALSVAALAAAPASAQVWPYYYGYYPVEPNPVYALPYGYPPAVIYSEQTVAVPVITYAPVRVQTYTVTQTPPYYNVPPYNVYLPW